MKAIFDEQGVLIAWNEQGITQEYADRFIGLGFKLQEISKPELTKAIAQQEADLSGGY